MLQLIFLYVLTMVQKSRLIHRCMKCSNSFSRAAGLFFRSKQTTAIFWLYRSLKFKIRGKFRRKILLQHVLQKKTLTETLSENCVGILN